MFTMYVQLLIANKVDSCDYDNHARSFERAWCNDDNTDAKGLELAAHALRQRIQAGLAGRVGRLHAPPN